MEGLEPPTSWSQTTQSTNWPTFRCLFNLNREGHIWVFSYSHDRPIICLFNYPGADNRSRTYKIKFLRLARMPIPSYLHMAPWVGLEPTTLRLTAECYYQLSYQGILTTVMYKEMLLNGRWTFLGGDSVDAYLWCIPTYYGAGGGSRTHTMLPPLDFKSSASAIPPHQHTNVRS